MTTQHDPFALYRVAKKGIPETLEPPENIEQDTFSEYRIKKPEAHEEGLRDIPRQIGGIAARGVETAGGIPGGYQKGFGALLDLITQGVEKVTGQEYPKLRKVFQDPYSSLGKHRELIEQIERSGTAPEEKSIFTEYPTSEEIKQQFTEPMSEQLFGNKELFEPKDEYERFRQDIVKDVVNLSGPGSNARGWLGKLGLSMGGNTAKELSKQLGFEPSTQELIKLGTLGVLSLSSLGDAPRFAAQNFQRVRNAMPRGIRFRTVPLENNIRNIRNSDWFRGHATPSTTAARQMIDAIEQRIQNGTLSARDAMTLRENINEYAHNLGAFSVPGTHKTAHVAHLNEVRDALINGMEQTLGRQYPNWWRNYQEANTAFGMTRRSSAIAQFIENHYSKPILSDAGKILFGNALSKGAAGIAKLGIGAAAVGTGTKAITIANRLRNPVLRRYYGDVVRASLRNDGYAMSEALRKFDEKSLEEEKKEKAANILRRRD